MAKKYYAKLFKEYAIADLSRYKESKVGLRWRTEQEVVIGKGQFACGAKGCDERRALASYEVHFAYKEAGEHKQALVKVRLCPKHAMQLNHKQNQRLIKKHKQESAAEQGRDAKRHKAAVNSSAEEEPVAANSTSSQASGSEDVHSRHHKLKQANLDKSEELFEGLFE